MRAYTPEMFWSKVDRKDLDECWNWVGTVRPEIFWAGLTPGGRCYKVPRVAAFLSGLLDNPRGGQSALDIHV